MTVKGGRVGVLAALFTLVALFGARAEEKPTDEGKASEFKGKTFELKAKAKAAIILSFQAGKKAKITVKSTGKPDVHLFVYDADKKEVAKDDSAGPDCDLTFTPKEAGKFILEVRNLGPGDTKSTLKVVIAK